jgi:hypothetical protein
MFTYTYTETPIVRPRAWRPGPRPRYIKRRRIARDPSTVRAELAALERIEATPGPPAVQWMAFGARKALAWAKGHARSTASSLTELIGSVSTLQIRGETP